MQFKRSLSDRIKSCSSYIFESIAYVHLEIELIRREISHNYQAIEKQYLLNKIVSLMKLSQNYSIYKFFVLFLL